MRRYFLILVIFLGILMYLGIDIWSLLGGVLLLILVMTGILFMVGRKFPNSLLEIFFILLIGPVLVSSFIHLLIDFIKQLSGSDGISGIPVYLLLFLIVIALLGFTWILLQRSRNRRVDTYRVQGSEREPVIPDTFSHRDRETINDD